MDNDNINPPLPERGFFPPVIVWIEWIDSAAHAEQNITPTDEHLTPIRCIAVGQLVTEDAAGVTLALEQFNNGCYRHAVTIPTECIIARRQIEPAVAAPSEGTK